MFNHHHYVPVLKWRMGEFQALMRLSEPIKAWVTPLLEIPTEGWNFETEAPMKSLDDHLANFGDRLFAKWGNRDCFIDSPYLDATAVMATGIHHVVHIFNTARSAGCQAIPVTSLVRDAAYQTAVRHVVASDGRGLCLRLTQDEVTPSISGDINAFFQAFGLQPKDIDLVIDVGDDVVSSPHTQALVWQGLMAPVKGYQWRTFSIVGTAFPSALGAATYRPNGRAPRSEWLAYKSLLSLLPEGERVPTFGDYATSHPATSEMDPRMLDPNAKVKYTLDDEWIIFVGTQVKKYGRGQYQTLCDSIVNFVPKLFYNSSYSWGDAYIAGCAAGTETTGGSSTWPTVATNHHITKAVRGIATLHGSSTPP